MADYGRLLAHDSHYAERAAVVSALHMDIGQVIAGENLANLTIDNNIGPVAVHTPCSMEHGLGEPDLVQRILEKAGFTLTAQPDKVLCCGSAGTYSLLQPHTSDRIRERALSSLCAEQPAVIASGNVGCQLHLGAGTDVPVVHWIELLDS